jgi:hypothetical protein
MTAWRVITFSTYGVEILRMLLNYDEASLYADRLYFCNHTLHVDPLVCLCQVALLVKICLHISKVRVLCTSAFDAINDITSAVPKLECEKLYHSSPCIFM